MTDLIARLEAAEVGSRELDEAISTAMCDSKFRTCIEGLSDEQGGMWMYEFEGHAPSSALRVTTSLDAALALAERVLDGDFSYDLFHDFGGYNRAKVHGITDGPVSGEGKAETMPLALCIAILKAKDAQS